MRFDNKGRGGPGRGRGRGRGGGHRNQHSHEQQEASNGSEPQPSQAESQADGSNAPSKTPIDDNRFDSSAAKAFLDARWEAASNNPATIKHKQQTSAWGNGRAPFRKTDFVADVVAKARSSA